MRLRDARTVPIAAAAWASSGAAILVPESAVWIAAGLWCAALTAGGIAAVIRRGGAFAIAVIALALAAAAASHVALDLPARAPASDLAVGGGRAVSVVLTVVGKVERSGPGVVAFDAQAHRISAGRRSIAVDVPVIVRTTDSTRPDIGAEVVADGTVRGADRGERAVLIVEASRSLRSIRAPSGVLGVTAWLRHRLVGATRGLPEPAAGLIAGLAVGDTSAVGPELDASMKASSLSHLTAVSGANCAIVVGLVFIAAGAVGLRRGVRVGVAGAALAGFVLLVTPEPSVVRAAAMAAIAMLGVQLGRIGAGISLLATAVSVVLIADPWLASSLGFALSAAATAALLVLAGPLARGLTRWLPRPLAVALSVPLAAQLACGPLLILVNPSVSLYGVVANLLAAPAAPVATVVGLAACLAAPWPALQSGLAAIAWLPAEWIASTAGLAVALPSSALPWPEGWVGAGALAVAGAAVCVLALPARPGAAARALRALSAGGLAIAIGVSGGAAAVRTVAGPLTAPRDWIVAACDIGQGDAVLVRSHGVVALVDTGPEPEPLRRCLARLGIDRIALLVLTHFDLDHVGGVDAVRARADVVLHGPPADAEQEGLIDGLSSAGAHVVLAHAGMTGTLGDARWSVLWPPPDSRAFPTGNEASVTVDIRGPAFPPSIFLGDLDAIAQRALLRSGALRPPYAIVKVAHHGSADQAPELYRALRPAVAVVSVGIHNDYGHPRAETLALLHEVGSVVSRTDRDGMVLIVQVGRSATIWRERGPPPAGTAEAYDGPVRASG